MVAGRPRKADWHRYADSILNLLPQSAPSRSQHKSFNDVFRTSRLATIPTITSQPPSYFARHQQPYPQHQVLSSFNSAHRRGDWGLKRPLPPVRDAHIIITELDTQERQTPYTFATEKPRFVRRMKDFGLVLSVPSLDSNSAKDSKYLLSERVTRRQASPLAHLHPQWNRKVGNETGPWILSLSSKEFSQFLGRIPARRPELDSARTRLGIFDGQRVKHLVQACLDIPLHKPAYKTHPTAGLTYTARGAMPSTPTGTQSDPRTIVGAPRKGRLVRGAMDGSYTALVSGVVAKVKNVGRSRYLPDRAYPVDVYPYDGSAVIDRHGRLDLQVSLSPPSAPPTVRSHEASPHLNFRPQQTGASNRTYRVD